MVKHNQKGQERAPRAAMVMLELVVAMGILVSVMLPVAFSFAQEQRLARGYYFRAVAMEIVDGEMEALLAGEWREFPKGRQSYKVHGDAARNLPPGEFSLSIGDTELELQWRPVKHSQGGAVSRVALLPGNRPQPPKAQP